MEISGLFARRSQPVDHAPRKFSLSADPCPPLRSFPGVITGTSAIWEEISDMARIVTVPKGEILYPDHTRIPPYIYLKSGKLCANFINEDGSELLLHFIFKGGMIWEGFFSINGQVPPMPFKALEECVIHVFDSALDFNALLAINPMLVRNLLYSQSVKNLTYSKLAMIQYHRKPLAKVAHFLYEMHMTLRKNRFPGVINQREMSRLLHLHKVTISNALGALKKMGVLETFSKTDVILPAPEKLLPIIMSDIRELRSF